MTTGIEVLVITSSFSLLFIILLSWTAVCDHRCQDGRCLYKDYICDGYFDCIDGSDEIGCGTGRQSTYMCLEMHHTFEMNFFHTPGVCDCSMYFFYFLQWIGFEIVCQCVWPSSLYWGISAELAEQVDDLVLTYLQQNRQTNSLHVFIPSVVLIPGVKKCELPMPV